MPILNHRYQLPAVWAQKRGSIQVSLVGDNGIGNGIKHKLSSGLMQNWLFAFQNNEAICDKNRFSYRARFQNDIPLPISTFFVHVHLLELVFTSDMTICFLFPFLLLIPLLHSHAFCIHFYSTSHKSHLQNVFFRRNVFISSSFV